MLSDKKLLVLGGDMRILKMAESMIKAGFNVRYTGLSAEDAAIDLNSILENREIVILGLPCTRDHETVNMPFSNQTVYFKDLLRTMNKNQILIGGMISEKIRNLANLYNISCVDYFERDELAVLNAIPTAEGAIAIAMEELPVTIHDSKCLILGNGRIGKVLAHRLSGLGAQVTVAARKHSDLAWIKTYGYDAIHINDILEFIDEYNVIFNTVPFHVIMREHLSKMKCDCLVIDLASKPGGVDFILVKILYYLPLSID